MESLSVLRHDAPEIVGVALWRIVNELDTGGAPSVIGEVARFDVTNDMVPMAHFERRVLERLDLNEQVGDIEILDGGNTIGAIEQ